MLPIIDIVLLLILAGFVFYGLFFGLIKTAGSLIGVTVGTWVASRTYLIFFGWVSNLALGHENLGKILSFIICFTIVNRLVGLIFALIDKAYSILTIVPFLKTINRLAGAVLGLIQGGFVLGIFLYIIGRYTPEGSVVAKMFSVSQFAPFLLNFGNVLTPLLPEIVKRLKSII